MGIFRVIARPLLAAPYIYDGVRAALNPQQYREQVTRCENIAATLGVEVQGSHRDLAVRALGITRAVGGGLLAVGKHQRLSGALLTATQIPVTISSFAAAYEVATPGTDPAAATTPAQTSGPATTSGPASGGTAVLAPETPRKEFFANLGLMGGALLAAIDRKGQPSLGYRYARWREHRAEISQVKQQMKEDARRHIQEAKKA
ncbi:DoxX family membrane protein [Actinobaculum suis]|uniref:DoxX family membrane protein n=1 Tax=Actinobaculum suis TaxID=1657 RepID=UPI000808671B|nr:DoxX family membrane protein [Actinobaculum suis]OCA94611.1 hypothetical protein ACU20_06610 [Actinobaculum suis]OCA94923.1 hypothetical protein ACU21_05400 [Actinobaculum suis]